MVEPHSVVLARLCVMCILSTMETQNTKPTKKRRSRPSESADDIVGGGNDLSIVGPLIKSRKIDADGNSMDFVFDTTNAATAATTVATAAATTTTTSSTTSTTISGGASATPISAIGGDSLPPSSSPPNVVAEPLRSAVQGLFKSFAQFVAVDDLSPKVYFIHAFLSLLVQCGGGGQDRVRPLLKLLPQGLVQNLLKVIVTDESTIGFILRFVCTHICGGENSLAKERFLSFHRIHDLTTTTGRSSAMSDLCLLRNIQLRTDSINL